MYFTTILLLNQRGCFEVSVTIPTVLFKVVAACNKLNFTAFFYSESGEAYMEEQGIDFSFWGLWQNLMALLCITVGLLIITYIQLRRNSH